MLAAPLAVVSAASPAQAAPVDIQILATNDFHGRLLPSSFDGQAGAAQLAGAVAQLEADQPNSVFVAAGDLIGASTFESFIQKDKPTIDSMNAADLDVSAAGNHEWDAGHDDLVDRVMAPFDPVTNEFGGAEWQYLAANVRDTATGDYALPDVAASPGTSDGATWMTEVAGVQLGFVGVVTEELPSLVNPAGIADITVTDIVDETNLAADNLKAAGADVVVMLIHEGATTTDISSVTDNSAFGQIVAGVDSDVSAIVSGHTHLAYNHVVDGRPVVSAGQYGINLNQLVFTVDPEADTISLKQNDIVPAADVELTAQAAIDKAAEVQAIVDAAVAEADVLGAEVLGEISAPFNRAKMANGTSENRGGESTLGNLVAEVQRWATESEEAGSAQIAFMNPGGLRADMVGNNGGGYPAELTYKQAAIVQPFANTLVNMDMTGSTIKKILEQQWQRDAEGNVPSRPFLRLGTSEGFRYTYDPARPEGDRITGMWLDGVRLRAGQVYSVTANSFLANAGDNFHAFDEALAKRDSGKVDLEAMVDYMAAQSPVGIDPTQHAVGVSFDAPSYAPGDTVEVDFSSLAFSTAPDPKDTSLEVSLDGTPVATVPVDNTIGTAVSDEYGTATASFAIPETMRAGRHTLSFEGDVTGTTGEADLYVKTASALEATATPATIEQGTGTSTIAVEVTSPGDEPTGTVAALLDGEVIGGAQLEGGRADVPVGPFDTAGEKLVTLEYYGDENNDPATGEVTLTVTPAPVVEKAQPTITATVDPSEAVVHDDETTLGVTVSSAAGTPTGAVVALVDGEVVGAGELAAGRTEITLDPFTTVGTQSVQLKYFGDDATKAGTTTAAVEVVKATPKVKVKAPDRVRQGTRARITVVVKAKGYTPTGKVRVKVRGKKVTKKLDDGRVVLRIRMTKPGKNKVKVVYLGDDLTERAKEKVSVRVRRR